MRGRHLAISGGAHSRSSRKADVLRVLLPPVPSARDGGPPVRGRERARFYWIIYALEGSRSALRAHAHKDRHRLILGGCPVVLGVPFGTGPAHVIKFGPVRVEKAPGQALHEIDDIGQDARLVAAVPGVASSCLFHDPSGRYPAGSPFAPFGIAQCASLFSIVRVNLLKTSRNLPVISDSWTVVAEKIQLGLRIDAIRSHFPRRGVPTAGYAPELLAGDRLRAANQHWRGEGIGGAGGRQRKCGQRRVRLTRAVILGVPFGPWTAHVVQLRPIGVEQGSGQTVQEFADIGSSPRFLAASGTSENCGRCPDHDGIRWAWWLSIHSLVIGRRAGVQLRGGSFP